MPIESLKLAQHRPLRRTTRTNLRLYQSNEQVAARRQPVRTLRPVPSLADYLVECRAGRDRGHNSVPMPATTWRRVLRCTCSIVRPGHPPRRSQVGAGRRTGAVPGRRWRGTRRRRPGDHYPAERRRHGSRLCRRPPLDKPGANLRPGRKFGADQGLPAAAFHVMPGHQDSR